MLDIRSRILPPKRQPVPKLGRGHSISTGTEDQAQLLGLARRESVISAGLPAVHDYQTAEDTLLG